MMVLRKRATWLNVIILLTLLLSVWQPTAAQEPTAETAVVLPYQAEVEALMAQMDARDRVGQLFLVTFLGDTAESESLIADLILNYHIGGVVLQAGNDNITDENEPATQVAGLINELQTRAHEASQQPREALPGETEALPPTPFIPLLVAMDHEGDNYPFTNILAGLTEIPNNMAIGATWNPGHAETVGRIVGQELSAIGVNMLIGPSLDVLETPRPESPGGLGTRSFGGDPYWVGIMGQAYTRGVHLGSGNRMAVVGKHFPGHGGSDRQPGQDVPTVRKSLEQLKQIELAPFFAVTSSAPPTDTVDALMTSHIRYQGFQGNIRESTRPISFDPQALATIMALPSFATWRQGGGVIVSDALGVRAVKRFYDPQLEEFPHRQIAQDAFLAGNDLLVLSEFALSASYFDQVNNIKDTLDWFYEFYSTDVSFQTQVDQAVERILRLKLQLYAGRFELEEILSPVSRVSEQLGNSQGDVVLLAQDAITLIAPAHDEVADRLSSAPNKSENIVIFTDIRNARQCSTCSAQPLIGVNTIQNTILRLYGPDGTNQVLPGRISSFSFQELEDFLLTPPQPIVPEQASPTPESGNPEEETPAPEPTPEPPPAVQTALETADWIIFAMLDVSPNEAQSDAVSTFLAERPDIASNTETIVLAFNAPYYLDTTEISKLTAYYGVYSKIGSFIETSVKAIFQQFQPHGSSPVSIPSTGYDLIQVTSPSQDQIIQLYFDDQELSEESTAPGDLRVGDVLKLRTGVIVDHNQNPVPDGTLVQFTVSYLSEGLGLDVPQPEVPTTNGIARIDIMLQVPGQLQIKASSGDARASVGLAVTVFEDQPPIVEEITPVPSPTPTATPPPPTTEPTPTPTTVSPTATPSPTPTPEPIIVPRIPLEQRMNMGHLTSAMVGIAVAAGIGFWLGWNMAHDEPGWSIRLPLLVVIGGLLGYNYFALDLPGSVQLNEWMGNWSATVLAWVAGLLTLLVGSIWLKRQQP